MAYLNEKGKSKTAIILVLLGLIIVIGIFYFNYLFNFIDISQPPAGNSGGEPPPSRDYCETAEDCIAATCCHPDAVVNEYYAPDCAAVSCTASCEGPLECGAGDIVCQNNRCIIVPVN